jgi:hypothetical protein
VPTALRALAAVRPDIEVVAAEGPTDMLMARLADGALDLAVVATTRPDCPRQRGVTTGTLCEDELLAALPREHRLAGSGPVDLRELRDEAWVRREWIAANSDIITAAAQRSGLPRDMVAGIAWQEVGGQWGWMDDGVDTVRELARDGWLYDSPESLPSRLGGSPDETSFGPIAIQVRRAAEVLGYDPAHLTDSQRDTIEASLQDPGQNIFIASEYLAMLKEESDFADVPADEMTGEQRQELAARYNGGPYWQDDKAQAYGRGFDENLDDARSALK